MTTTAAAWRHVEGRRAFGSDICYAPVQTGETPQPCGCTTPTPDAASPCGMVRSGHMTPCDADPSTLDAEGWHEASWDRKPHRVLPTRCLCGHTLEAVRYDPSFDAAFDEAYRR